MSGLLNAVVILAVVALVLARQLKPSRVAEGGRWWIVPAVLVVLAVREHGFLDPHHTAASVGLLAVEILIGAGTGTAWAFTTRIWRDDSGVAWTQGTKATAVAWVGGIALRVGTAVLGAMLGVHQGSGATMLALAATLLIRTGVVVWRANGLEPAAYRMTATP